MCPRRLTRERDQANDATAAGDVRGRLDLVEVDRADEAEVALPRHEDVGGVLGVGEARVGVDRAARALCERHRNAPGDPEMTARPTHARHRLRKSVQARR